LELQLHNPLVFFDLETTGIDPSKDRIVQMHFIKRRPDGGEEIYAALVNPGIPISAEATEIHGIRDQDVQGERTFQEIALELMTWLSGSDLAGYNSNKFDIPLLAEEFHRAGHDYNIRDIQTIDVFLLEKKVNSHKLEETYKRYTGKSLDDAHDAGADIRATMEILDHQLARNPHLGDTIEGLGGPLLTEEGIDLAGKLKIIDGEACYTFGKHKGHPVKNHTDYARWMIDNDFPAETKRHLRAILASLS